MRAACVPRQPGRVAGLSQLLADQGLEDVTAPARPLEWNHVEIETEEADTVFFRLLYSF